MVIAVTTTTATAPVIVAMTDTTIAAMTGAITVATAEITAEAAVATGAIMVVIVEVIAAMVGDTAMGTVATDRYQIPPMT